MTKIKWFRENTSNWQTLWPVFDVAAEAKSGHFNDRFEDEHWRKEKVEDLESKMKLLLHTTGTQQRRVDMT